MAIDSPKWNPYYLAYCHAQGTPDPVAMGKKDEKEFPGGPNCGFILWMSEQKMEFRKAHPEAFFINSNGHVTSQLGDYDAWGKWVTRNLPPTPT